MMYSKRHSVEWQH